MSRKRVPLNQNECTADFRIGVPFEQNLQSEFMILVIVFISMLVLFYFLWVNGYMILNAKRALLFVGSLRGKNKCEVSFSSCSGYVKKVIKFNESREYTFKLDGDISKGSIHVIVENKNKETILDLTPEIKTGMLTVDEKCRYYLMLKFEKADGKIKLQWD